MTTLINFQTNFHKEIIQDLEAFKELKERITNLKLEAIYQTNNKEAELEGKLKSLQITVDKIKEYQTKKKHSNILNAIAYAIEEIQFLIKNKYSIPEYIIDILKSALDERRKSVESLDNSFQDFFRPLILILKRKTNEEEISFLDIDFSKKELEQLVTKLEFLGEVIEENIDHLDFCTTELLEKIFDEMVSSFKIKSGENTKKEEYRRRIRYAAGFILNLIDNSRMEIEYEEREVKNDFLMISSFED